jgi:hypothetical protein
MTLSRNLGIAALAAAMALGATGFALAERGDHARMGMEGRGPMAGLDFAALDADGDGKITKEEMQAPRAARLAALDADGDGKISLEELKADHLRQATERADQRAQRMMAAMDADGDGMLTAAELLAGPGPGMMFDRVDTDGDGAISKAEADAIRDRMADRMARRGEHRGHGRMKHDN